MGIARERVTANFQKRGFAPGSVAAVGGHDRGIARIRRIARALRNIHRTLVGREAAGSLVKLGVQS